MTDIDTQKILAKWKLETKEPKKVDEYVNKIAKKLVTNIVKNIIHVKEATIGKSAERKITMSDIKETQQLMNRLRFYSQLQYNMNGGSYTVLPPSYFNEQADEPMYSANGFKQSGTEVTNTNNSIARPAFASSQFEGDGVIRFAGPDGIQSGGGLLEKVKSIFQSKKGLKYVDNTSIESVIEEMNKKYKKNAISLENDKVVKVIKDSVNKNMNILMSYYTSKVSSKEISVDALKQLIKNEPLLAHMGDTPNV